MNQVKQQQQPQPPFKERNMIDQADYVATLINQGYTQREVAKHIGMTIPLVCNLITLSNLPINIKNRVKSNEVSGSLVLKTIRSYGNLTQDEAVELVEKACSEAGKGIKVTQKDIDRIENRHPSIAHFRKIMKQNSLIRVTKNEEQFELLRGMLLGKLDRITLLKYFGLRN